MCLTNNLDLVGSKSIWIVGAVAPCWVQLRSSGCSRAQWGAVALWAQLRLARAAPIPKDRFSWVQLRLAVVAHGRSWDNTHWAGLA